MLSEKGFFAEQCREREEGGDGRRVIGLNEYQGLRWGRHRQSAMRTIRLVGGISLCTLTLSLSLSVSRFKSLRVWFHNCKAFHTVFLQLQDCAEKIPRSRFFNGLLFFLFFSPFFVSSFLLPIKCNIFNITMIIMVFENYHTVCGSISIVNWWGHLLSK